MTIDEILDEQLAAPERLADRVQQCAAITETGERCHVLTLHAECWRHRRQLVRADEADDA